MIFKAVFLGIYKLLSSHPTFTDLRTSYLIEAKGQHSFARMLKYFRMLAVDVVTYTTVRVCGSQKSPIGPHSISKRKRSRDLTLRESGRIVAERSRALHSN